MHNMCSITKKPKIIIPFINPSKKWVIRFIMIKDSNVSSVENNINLFSTVYTVFKKEDLIVKFTNMLDLFASNVANIYYSKV